ncbi:hypothetical protein BS17DRAFT_730241 [Gyrodon lividus]|nr:hypothetical protein BS17DRAFT_730241 [Gyrodon lividus]
MPSSTPQSPSPQDIWKWTLTKAAIAPCFVRDALAMRESDADFFWLGYTPCRSVLLVGMVVAIQVYEKRTIYTIDDGTAVIDCLLRHPTAPKSKPATVFTPTAANTKSQRPLPKKARIERDNAPGPPAPPPPVTEPGYPVHVVGKVVKHHESRQVLAESIDHCLSSLDEIAHWKRVIELHKTKYSLAIPFVLPSPQAAPTSASLNASSISQGDAGVFTSRALVPVPTNDKGAYRLPAARAPLQNRPVSASNVPYMSANSGHVPSSPTNVSIASSTPSIPCKTSSPVTESGFGEPPPKPKLRHPSRLHTCDLTANTFRLYVKHYMDNAPPPPSFPPVKCSRIQSDDEDDVVSTLTKQPRYHEDRNGGGRTPRPGLNAGARLPMLEPPTLGFTLAHLRRVPELALLAARVVRAETKRREKAERDQERQKEKARRNGDATLSFIRVKPPASQAKSMTSHPKPTSSRNENDKGKPPASASTSASASTPSSVSATDPSRKKMKRLFAWAVVKLYEEGSIVLWDGDVRPLPVPVPVPVLGPGPSLVLAPGAGLGAGETSVLWKTGDSTTGDSTIRSSTSSISAFKSYSYSAQALASHDSPHRHHHSSDEHTHRVPYADADTDPSYLSDAPANEEAYVTLTPRFLARYVREAVAAMEKARCAGGRVARGNATSSGSNDVRSNTDANASALPGPTPEDIVAYLRRTDTRWARVGAWAVEEALEVLNGGVGIRC